jgi:arylsulfatase A-like enzyme
MSRESPNVVFVFADQWRQQATSLAGDPNVATPHIERLAQESLHFLNAASGCPVCSPARATLMTGQQPDTHGVFVNDVELRPSGTPLGEAFRRAGYRTGYIGKWHIHDHGRSAPVPPEARLGFEDWWALECTHDYFNAPYYAGDETTPRVWPGYDAEAQTRTAENYIRARAAEDRPFFLTLSWGPPHAPYHTAPDRFRARHRAEDVILRDNVPAELADRAREHLAGYYAHCEALDELLGDLMGTIEEAGIAENTILVFWSDHGDMLGSQGHWKKQRPWDESARVPLLIRYPALFGRTGREIEAPIGTVDLMPTLLGLAGLEIPEGVQGRDFTPFLKGETEAPWEAVLLACYHPFGQYTRSQGGREYRGVRTARHTYVRDRAGPWFLFDNLRDPEQLTNLAGAPNCSEIREALEAELQRQLRAFDDRFRDGWDYVAAWGYETDEEGTVPFRW